MRRRAVVARWCVRLVAGVGVMMSHVAGAQLPGAAAVPGVAPDSLPSFERPNGMLLRTGTLTYALSLIKPGGATTALGVRTVTTVAARLGGTPGWLVAEERTGSVVPTSDSVYLSRADLAPERWSATNGASRVGASFSRDSVFGAVDSYQGRSSFALGVPSTVVLSAGMLERVLEMLPLRDGYHVSASLLLIEGAAPHLVPAEIIVRAPESVDVGGTSVDAWLVLLRWGASEERLWVTRGTARVVRTEQAVAAGILTSVLQQP